MAVAAQETKLEVGTGTGDAVATVTAAVGYPTIITKATHGLDEGDIVATSLFAGANAADMNGLTLICRYVTTNTLALDVNTIGMTLTAANGTLTPVTWTEVAQITGFDGPSPNRSERAVTDLQSTEVEVEPGLPDPGSMTLNVLWHHTDTGQDALTTAYGLGTLLNFRITYSDAETDTFSGYVMGHSHGETVDGNVEGTITIRRQSTV